MREQKHEKNPIFNRLAPIMCGVQCCDEENPDCEHRKSHKVSRFQNTFFIISLLVYYRRAQICWQPLQLIDIMLHSS